ncbi:hypothetical protein CMI42_06275 [Candidatus Pacearchaeota archaeon]|nr:hypothetical protein [Candidatus Pacearchaeota archaeon]|tara:strand:+ start:265 stop:585 length:321 start_codon:yes stop_codon:yes gene_type:complete
MSEHSGTQYCPVGQDLADGYVREHSSSSDELTNGYRLVLKTDDLGNIYTDFYFKIKEGVPTRIDRDNRYEGMDHANSFFCDMAEIMRVHGITEIRQATKIKEGEEF